MRRDYPIRERSIRQAGTSASICLRTLIKENATTDIIETAHAIGTKIPLKSLLTGEAAARMIAMAPMTEAAMPAI